MTCKFCGRGGFKFLIGHERQCRENPDRYKSPGMTGKTSWRKGLSIDDPRIASERAKAQRTKDANGTHVSGCAAWSREQRSAAAKQQGFGGYRENAGRSHKHTVDDSYGKSTVLQSSYELRCAEILNELGIKWIRPKALKYDGKNYFADFYLPDFDIWLDPKNDHKAKLDAEKISKVIEQNNVKLYVLLDSHINIEYIARLVQ